MTQALLLARGAVALVLVVARPVVTGAQSRAPAATPLVFDGATIVDVEQGKLVPDQRVVVVGNRIQAMGTGSQVAAPQGAKVVNARGKYLIPGLWDMHIHPMDQVDAFFPLMLANGITGFRDASSSMPIDSLRRWRQEVLDGTRVGPPRQILSTKAIDEAEGCQRTDDGSFHTCISGPDEAAHVVDSLKAAGYDMIKTYTMSPTAYLALASAARRAHFPVGGHINVPGVLGDEASDSGVTILDHPFSAGGLDTMCLSSTATAERCQTFADHFRRNGTWWIPTFIIAAQHGDFESKGQVTQPGFARIDSLVSRFWNDGAANRYAFGGLGEFEDAAPDDEASGAPGAPSSDSTTRKKREHNSNALLADSVGRLVLVQRVSMPILIGTDATPTDLQTLTPGFALHAEMAVSVGEGLTPLTTLQAVTLNPAKVLHATDSLGTIAPGKLADLVLLDADPLQDITSTTRIRAVVANGRYYDRAALDRLLADVRAAH